MDEISTIRELAEYAGARIRAALVESNHSLIRQHHEKILRLIGEGDETIGPLATRLGVTQQAVSKVVIELRVAGYVTQKIDVHDSRRRLLTVTPQGNDALNVCRSTYTALWDEITKTGFRDMRIHVEPMPLYAA